MRLPFCFAIVSNAVDIALDTNAGKFYWTEQRNALFEAGTGKLRKANLSDGSGAITLLSDLNSPTGIALHTPELPPGAFPALGFVMSGLLLALRKKFSR